MLPVKFGFRILKSNLIELQLPYRLTFAVTNRCQSRCTMCNIWRKPVHDELGLEEIDALFSKADHFSWINLTGGELFQRPDINDIFLTVIKHSRDLWLLNFPTNGFLTDAVCDSVARILKETDLSRLIVSVSLDGPPSLHDDIRGIPGCWGNAVQTFRRLRKLRSRRFSVYFGQTVQSANIGRFTETLDACREVMGDVSVNDFHINLAHSSGHYYDNENSDALPDAESAAAEIEYIQEQQSPGLLDPVAFIEQRYRRHVRDYFSNGRGPYVCQAAGASCFIDPVGTVYPCSVFDAPLGSLRDYNMDFRGLWRSDARLQTRELIKSSKCPGCWTPCEAYQTLLANLLR